MIIVTDSVNFRAICELAANSDKQLIIDDTNRGTRFRVESVYDHGGQRLPTFKLAHLMTERDQRTGISGDYKVVDGDLVGQNSATGNRFPLGNLILDIRG